MKISLCLSLLFLFTLLFSTCNLEEIPNEVEMPPPTTTPTKNTFELFLGEQKPSRGYDITPTSDGNYVIVGETGQAGGSGSDLFLIKIDTSGVEIWPNPKSIGGAASESGKAVKEAANGDLVITGDVTANNISTLYYVRTFSDGTVRNELSFENGSTSRGSDIVPLSDGSNVLVGATNLCALPADCNHMWFFKIDAQAEITGINDGYGSGISTTGSGVAMDGSGGFLAIGSQFDNDPGNSDIYLAYQGGSSFENFPSFNLLMEGGDQFARAVVSLIDNTFAITGYSDNNASGPSDLLLLRVNKSLALASTPVLIGGSGTERGNDIALTADGGLIIVGETTSSGEGGSDVYLVKTDLSGTVEWEATHGGAFKDVGEAVVQTPDGGYLIVGYSQLSSDPDDVAMYVIKTDEMGQVE